MIIVDHANIYHKLLQIMHDKIVKTGQRVPSSYTLGT